jgi:hypothetical protein
MEYVNGVEYVDGDSLFNLLHDEKNKEKIIYQ